MSNFERQTSNFERRRGASRPSIVWFEGLNKTFDGERQRVPSFEVRSSNFEGKP